MSTLLERGPTLTHTLRLMLEKAIVVRPNTAARDIEQDVASQSWLSFCGDEQQSGDVFLVTAAVRHVHTSFRLRYLHLVLRCGLRDKRHSPLKRLILREHAGKHMRLVFIEEKASFPRSLLMRQLLGVSLPDHVRMSHEATIYGSGPTVLEPLLDIRAAAATLDTSVRTVYRLVAAGEITPTKVGAVSASSRTN